MLQWNDFHPYNAVHVVRIPEVLEVQRLKNVITSMLGGKGLTGLVIDRSAGTYQYLCTSATAEIKIVPVQTHPTSPAFAAEIECQLNTPFPAGGCFTPFRFVVVPEKDAFMLGLVYFHPVADAESIVFLLKDMVDVYRAAGDLRLAYPLERYTKARENLLRYYPGVLARKLASLPSSIRNMRRACRPRYRDPADMNNKFMFFSLNSQALDGVTRAAKSWNVTLNDLFLALLMKGVSLLASDRPRGGRRKNLALGCIVNTRRDLGLDGKRTFGLFLGSFVVHHGVLGAVKLADLARGIGRQTLAIKQRRLYLGAALELSFGELMASFFSEQRRRRLYQKHYPLWGGLTNMNLNKLWPQPEGSRPVDYFRAVSTGPVAPLVASITTIGQVANIGLTYRPTVFGAPDIERIKAAFLDPLGPLAHP